MGEKVFGAAVASYRWKGWLLGHLVVAFVADDHVEYLVEVRWRSGKISHVQNVYRRYSQFLNLYFELSKSGLYGELPAVSEVVMVDLII